MACVRMLERYLNYRGYAVEIYYTFIQARMRGTLRMYYTQSLLASF